MPQQLSLFDAAPVTPPPPPTGRILIARGARAAEAVVLERVAALAAEARREPALLAQPVRIVVPSRSLRLHLAAAIVRTLGRSVAGVTVQTLFGLAREILERSGEPAPRGEALFGLLVRRFARRERSLAAGLETLVDGYGAVVGTVRDLIDAGFEPAHADALEETLATDGSFLASGAEIARARALVRIAASTERAMEGLELGSAAHLLRRAAAQVLDRSDAALPARSILIHGFAEATGVATDLLEALVRKTNAWVVLDRPPRPGDDGDESAFTERFAARLAGTARLETVPARSAAVALMGIAAPGAEAEAREVAVRVRALLDGGTPPESIGIAARTLDPYRFALRRHFGRLGIPFSGVGESGGLEPAGRKLAALQEILRLGDRAPVDRWLDAVYLGGRVDLRLACAALGAARLRDVAELPLARILGDKDSFPLPIRQGLVRAPEENDGDESRGWVAAKRRVAGVRLRRAVSSAQRLCRLLAEWPESGTLAIHLDRLVLIVEALGWNAAHAADAELVAPACDRLARDAPAGLELDREELRLLLADELAGAGRGAIGGLGGGVQVLSVMEARGRTCEHLFLLGANRDVFPRVLTEDPLLPDGLRRVLGRVLPDLPIKLAGFDEERYLFAQALSAAPRVTLSWQIATDDGKPLTPSPLVERLGERLAVDQAPALSSLPAAGPRLAGEHAVLAGLYAPRSWFGRVLAEALREAENETASGLDETPETLAAARIAVLEELDPDLRTLEGRTLRRGLGPYFGWVGRDPWSLLEPVSVTPLERFAVCPWQVFLTRILRLEPTPDPLAALPGLDPLLLGNVIHRALERIARTGATAEDILDDEAERVLFEERILLPGLVRALAERALPYLVVARETDDAGPSEVVQVEVEGGAPIDADGDVVTVHFKADRLDRVGGVQRYTDYKTGRPLTEHRTPERRRAALLAAVRAGTHLQAVAYALGASEPAVARYLYLRPDITDREARELAVGRDDADFVTAFGEAARTIVRGLREGSFVPRVVDPAGRKEPIACSYCSVAQACVRGDSGARKRLVDWAERAREAHSERSAEQALLAVWDLPAVARESKE